MTAARSHRKRNEVDGMEDGRQQHQQQGDGDAGYNAEEGDDHAGVSLGREEGKKGCTVTWFTCLYESVDSQQQHRTDDRSRGRERWLLLVKEEGEDVMLMVLMKVQKPKLTHQVE